MVAVTAAWFSQLPGVSHVPLPGSSLIGGDNSTVLAILSGTDKN
jgi:hypothetical protein